MKSEENVPAPDGMLDHKIEETASVDSSEGIGEAMVPCNEPEAEKVPELENCPGDVLWTHFNEPIPGDSPSERLPLKGYIPKSFHNNFQSVFYSSCDDDYHEWIAEAVKLMRIAGPLNSKVCSHVTQYHVCVVCDVCRMYHHHYINAQQFTLVGYVRILAKIAYILIAPINIQFITL